MFDSPLESDRLSTNTGLQPILLPPLAAEPFVSVLVSCRNYQSFIGDCLASVLSQSYSQLEVVVCDDGSEDESRKVVKLWMARDIRVRLIEQGHYGMAASLNSAWRACRGDIICLLDADDTFLPEKIAHVVDAFRSNANAGLAIHRSVRTDALGRHQGVIPLFGRLPSGWCKPLLIDEGGVLPNLPPTSNFAIRREIAEVIFPLPEVFQGYAERVIQGLAPLLTEIIAINLPLATWRLHAKNDANTSEIMAKRIERDLRNMEEIWKLQRSYLDETAPATELRPLLRSDYYCRLGYICARLGIFRDGHQWLRFLLHAPGFRRRPLPERWFWTIAPYLPTTAFRTVINFLMTQGRFKSILSRDLGAFA